MSASVPRPEAETAVPANAVAQGAPHLPNPSVGSSASGNDGSGDLSGLTPLEQIERLAALLEPEAFDAEIAARKEWREEAKARARFHAARAISAGYRRVVVDDTTVDRVAEAIDDAVRVSWTGNPADFVSAPEDWTVAARAAVRAVLEGGQ